MDTPLKLIIIEDNEDDLALIVRELTRGGFSPEDLNVQDEVGLRTALDSDTEWDIILSDYAMPQYNALAALECFLSYEREIPFIVLSGTVGEEVAVETMKAGAHDYLMKGSLTRLVPAIQRELREAKIRRERQAMQEQLYQAQKMESVGRLAGGIAHDFNNLLTAIIGYAELVADKHKTGTPSRRYVDNILTAANRGADLIGQLLAFTRKQVITPQSINLNITLQETQILLDRLLSEEIMLVIETDPDLWNVRADAGQCQQILLNLAVNARDAMPEGGTLTLSLENLTLTEENRSRFEMPPGDYVLLTVEDTGVGIDAETEKHIFEPFYTTKERGKGTGLGLATCYGIVEQNGGCIRLKSRIGKGTTFFVLLPRLTEEPLPHALREDSILLEGTERILLVEDDRLLSEFAQEALIEHGYQIVTANDGIEAIKTVESSHDRIDLLLTDLVMPNMGGLELSARLLVTQPHLKVVFISGYAEEIEQSDHFDPENFLQKPFTSLALVTKVRHVLNGDD